jgi:iron complex outermembrane receptor protein
MKRTFLLSLLASMALVNANEIELPKMTIDAHHDALDVPSSSASVTAQTISESINIINTEDAVKYLPSIHIRKRYIGDRNGIIATRTSGTLSSAHSLVYADGVLLSNLLGNSYAFPPRWSMVNPEEIERIDVLYGPFLAQYPGNSIGNTLLITTQMPQKFQAHFDVQGFIEDYELYGTRESYKGGQGSLSVGNKNGDVTWALSYNHLDNTSHPMSYATFSPSTINVTGADKIVTGYYKDLDPSNLDRIVVGATSIDHTVQDTAKLKLAYDITPTASIMYTLGLWENDSQGSFDSYLRDSNGATVQTGTVNIEGKRYNLGSAFKNSITQQQHFMNALSFKTTTGGEWDVEAVASMYDYTTDESRTQNTSGSTSGTITDQDGTGWKTLDVIVDYRPHYAKEHLLKFGAHTDRYELASQTDNTADWENGSALSLNSRFGGTT